MQRNRKKLRRLLRTLQGAWERGGLAGVAARVAAWSVLPKRVAFVHDVDLLMLGELNPRALRPLSARYEFAPADRSVLEELVACTDTPASVELRREALARVFDYGASCVTVRDEGRVIAYVCAFTGTYHLTYDDYGPLTLPIELDARSIYLGNCFIRPEYRLRGLFPHLLAACIAERPAGTRVFGHIDVGNDHSFSSHLRLGFTPLMTITCLSFGNAPFFFQRPFGATRRKLVARRAPVALIEKDGAFALVPVPEARPGPSRD
jgi:hypothetical protein